MRVEKYISRRNVGLLPCMEGSSEISDNELIMEPTCSLENFPYSCLAAQVKSCMEKVDNNRIPEVLILMKEHFE